MVHACSVPELPCAHACCMGPVKWPQLQNAPHLQVAWRRVAHVSDEFDCDSLHLLHQGIWTLQCWMVIKKALLSILSMPSL